MEKIYRCSGKAKKKDFYNLPSRSKNRKSKHISF